MGRREAGQHRPAPPHQARQPLILPPKGTRVPPARGPLGGDQPGASPPMQKRKSRPPASVKENTMLATGCLTSWGRQSRPGPPPLLPGQTGRPPDLQARQQGLKPSPVAVPSAHSQWDPVAGVVVDVCFLALSSTEGTMSCDPVGQAHDGRLDTQGNASRLCSALTEGSLFPDTKKACHQRDPSSPASKVVGGSLAPRGPCSVDTRPWRPTAQAQPLAVRRRTQPPGWAGRRNLLFGTDSY